MTSSSSSSSAVVIDKPRKSFNNKCRLKRTDWAFFRFIFCLTLSFFVSVDATSDNYVNNDKVLSSAGGSSSSLHPINISITPSRARYMRFDGGRAARVVVEMVRNISENATNGTEIAYLQAYDKIPGDLAGTNYT